MDKQFKHSDLTSCGRIGGSYSSLTDPQQFAIIGVDVDNKKDYLKRTEASAEFVYRDYIISFSTSGLNHFACRTEVAVIDKVDKEIKNLTRTVEEAISWVNDLYAH